MRAKDPATVYDPVGHCIYCEATGDLQREHIVPFGLGGNLILPKASCRKCGVVTGRFEQSFLRNTLGNFRYSSGFPSRKKKERPNEVQVSVRQLDGALKSREIPIGDYPRVLSLMKMPPPRILLGKGESTDFKPDPWICIKNEDAERFFSEDWNLGTYRHQDFCRTLAKIAHSYFFAVADKQKMREFELLLPGLILGDYPYASQYVGCDSEEHAAEKELLHKLELRYLEKQNHEYALVGVRLFAMTGAPLYVVVTGRRSLQC